MAAYKYVILTAQERLNLANDWLRGRETDLYRAILQSVDPDNDSNVQSIRDQAERVSKEVVALEKELAG